MSESIENFLKIHAIKADKNGSTLVNKLGDNGEKFQFLMGNGVEFNSTDISEILNQLFQRNFPELIDFQHGNGLVVSVPNIYLLKSVQNVDPTGARKKLETLNNLTEVSDEDQKKVKKEIENLEGKE